ncbi:WD40 repeat-like-containing domain protein [Metarhizium album ARSEF 1941]|uniref:Anaphase-promoting complex subunit 4 n=1 Tax=Metarhizium album (strain ARSEF 1941) TaxID=1081103 RepID=A0A0B2X513_METAS|nr:WD40 repeat-like-containing domain protein [Metarhizium album ARSEF 1941]KHO00818.1 WD40 repeat-like-containing domain protein [Metarhizium album ARSEF 1941]
MHMHCMGGVRLSVGRFGQLQLQNTANLTIQVTPSISVHAVDLDAATGVDTILPLRSYGLCRESPLFDSLRRRSVDRDNERMAEPRRLALHSETELESRAPVGFPSSCPTLDLSATWDATDRSLFVFRPPRQAVSRSHQVGAPAPGTQPPQVVTVTWKPDGQFLAVGWSDGVVRLVGLETNKAAHHIPVCEGTDANISCIGWASCSVASTSPRDLPIRSSHGLSRDRTASDGDLPPNLPQELAFLEVDTALPKISPLPTSSAGADDDATVFTLRTGIEFLFQPPRREEYDQVNIMAVGTDDGKLQLNIYDSFVVGAFSSPVSDSPGTPYMISHAAHPHLTTHALVFARTRTEPEHLHLVPMDLPFISSSPINLCLLASKLTTLQKLLRYIRQTQLHMQVEWKNTRELPTRFLRSVQGDLEELPSGPRGIVPALYHTVVTGHAYEPVREWLVDSLAERGHKRWDKAVVSGLENLRSLVHENFLPALERCAIILSRLRGLAQFHDDRDDIGYSVTQISRLLDIIGCLSLVGHKILSNVMDELEHFNAFSTWLRFQIDRLASSSTAADELTEKEATLDTSKVLTYIERYLTSSPLHVYFDEVSQQDWRADLAHLEDGVGLLSILDAQLRKQESGQASRRALQHVGFLVSYVTTCSNQLFKDMAEATKRSVRFGRAVRLSIGQPITLMDTRICHTSKNASRPNFRPLIQNRYKTNQFYLFRSGVDIKNGISSNPQTTSTCIRLEDRKLVDLKFLNDETLVLLCTQTDNNSIVALAPVESEHLKYKAYDSSSDEIPTVGLAGLQEFVIPTEYAMRPVRMEVHDKTDLRGELPIRIYMLSSNRTTWRTFTIPQ